MSVIIKSVGPGVYTSYSLYRSTDPKQVFTGPSILTNTTGVFNDTTTADNTLYHYGIEMTAASGDKLRETVVSYHNYNDWGPFAVAVNSNLPRTNSALLQGSGSVGVLTVPGDATASMPNLLNSFSQAKLDAWQTAAGATCRLVIAAKAAAIGSGLLLGNRLLSMRYLENSPDLQLISGSSISSTTAMNQITLYQNYMSQLTDNSDTVVVNGFRWRFRLLDVQTATDYLNLFVSTNIPFVLPRPFALCARFPLATSILAPSGSTPAALFLLSENNPPGAVITNQVTSSSRWAVIPYFEYVGRV